MLVAKTHPGTFNTSYVAGMNVTNLATSTFSVSNTFDQAHIINNLPAYSPLGQASYTLLMWCPSATAFTGDGVGGNISASDRLGGF